MRKALLDSLGLDRVGTSFTENIPAPTGGWNTRDSVAEMKPLDATVLDNWYPRAGLCELRGGSYTWASGMTGTVRSMFNYSPPTSSGTLFAATDSGIYNITAGGSIGSPAMALTNGYVHGVNMVNSAGTAYWWGVNGADDVKLYNGSSWSTITSAITGVSTASLIFPWLFKHRIFCIEKASLNAWFLPIDSIQGAASKLPLGNLLHRGGYLVAGTSWTLDGGDGPDDLCVFITSEGEIAVYKGIDPSSASSWSLIGVFYVGRPLGRRCFLRIGGDIAVLVEGGVFLMSKLLPTGQTNYANALTAKIQPTITTQTSSIGVTANGWECCLYPRYDALLLNIPGMSAQYVMNTITKAWCSFSNWPAACFNVFNNVLYFGTELGVVRKAWDGSVTSDMSRDIVTTAHQAWNYYGTRTKLKRVELFRPLLLFDGPVETRWAISPDYVSVVLNSIMLREGTSGGPPWDISPWDTTSWGYASFRLKLWRAANHVPGYALALWLQTASDNSILSWTGTDYILGSGGAI